MKYLSFEKLQIIHSLHSDSDTNNPFSHKGYVICLQPGVEHQLEP